MDKAAIETGSPYGDLNQENPPIILIEGPDTVGKTTTARYLQGLIASHNLLKLSAAPGQKDNAYMRNVYRAATDLFFAAPKNTFIIDRYTPSERVYGGLYRGLTEEKSTHLRWAEEEMARRNGHVFLFLLNEEQYAERLAKRQAETNEKYQTVESLMRLHERYVEVVATQVAMPSERKWLVNADHPTEVLAEQILFATGMKNGEINTDILQNLRDAGY